MRRRSLAAAVLASALALAGCAGSPDAEQDPTPSSVPSTGPSSTSSSATTGSPSESDEDVVGSVVRFSAGDTRIDVTIGEDSPATRDFLAMLPMTVELEEFNGREKIADLPRELDWQGSPGSDPEDGDLIYFVPWGNIGFYYDAEGIGYSDQTLHLGTYEASEQELAGFHDRETTVEIVG